MNKKELSVKKSNYLNQASYKLSVIEQKVIALLAAQIKDDDIGFQPYCLDIREFQTLIGNKSMNYAYIEEVANSLQNRELHIQFTNAQGAVEHLNTRWLSSSRYIEGTGVVELRFDPNLQPFLLQLKNRFTMYRLENIIQLTSQFSIRLYELLKQYENIGSRTFTLEELREFIGIDDTQYRLYADFKRRVILAAQKELKEKSDVFFEFEEVKVGRSVGKLLFHIFTQPTPAKNITPVSSNKTAKKIEADDGLKELLEILPEEYRNKSSLKKTLLKYLASDGKDYVIRNIIYANDHSDRSNYRAYLSKSLQSDYGLAYQEDQEAKKEVADRQREAQEKVIKQQDFERLRVENEYANHKKAREMIAKLSDEEKLALELEAVQQLPEPIQEKYRRNKKDSIISMQIRIKLESIFINKHPEMFET